MRIWLVVALACAGLLAAARPAAACGVWRMTDLEKGREIKWLINSGAITSGKRRLGALYLETDGPHGPRVVAGRKVVFDVVGGALRKRGKKIGSLDAAGTLVLGKARYTIELTEPSDYHGMPAWRLIVRRGDDVILESAQAASLCAGMHRDPPMTEAEHQAEIRRRVAYYLAWRTTGG